MKFSKAKLNSITKDYEAYFKDWEVLETQGYSRFNSPVTQVVWFQSLSSYRAYRPMNNVYIPKFENLPVFAQVGTPKYLRVTETMHSNILPEIFSSMEHEFSPELGHSLSISNLSDKFQKIGQRESRYFNLVSSIIFSVLGEFRQAKRHMDTFNDSQEVSMFNRYYSQYIDDLDSLQKLIFDADNNGIGEFFGIR